MSYSCEMEPIIIYLFAPLIHKIMQHKQSTREQEWKQTSLGHEEDRVDPEEPEQLIYVSVDRWEKRDPDASYHRPRGEVRQRAECLDRLLEYGDPDLIEQERENDRSRKDERIAKQYEVPRVPKRLPEVG